MICVTIGRGRHSSLAEEWKAAAEAGAELVELRIDCLRRDPDLKRILKERPTPLVFTIRRGADGGLWRGNEEKRQQLLREAIALGVDYVDLEMDIAPKIRRFGKTKRIVSYHNFKKTPVEHPGYRRAVRRDATPTWSRSPRTADRGRGLARPSARRVTGKSQRSPSPWARSAFFTRILGAKFGARSPTPASTPSASSPPGMPQLPRSSSATTSTTRSTPRPRSTPSSATRSSRASARRSTTPRSATSA